MGRGPGGWGLRRALRSHSLLLPARRVLAAASRRARRRELGYDAIGVADCDGLYGIVRALEAADEAGIRLVTGCELAIDGEGGAPSTSLWLHVATAEGYRNLCRILTSSHARHPKGEAAGARAEGVPRNQFAGIPLGEICAASAGLWCTTPPRGAGELEALRGAFGDRVSLAVWRHLDAGDEARVRRVEALSRETGVAVCATGRPLFAAPEEKPIYDVLHCIREGLTLDEAGRALLPNAEAHLRSPEAMAALFAAEPPGWLSRSVEIADACRFSLRELEYRFPCELEASKRASHDETSDGALRRLSLAGAHARWPGGVPPSVLAQVERELALIAEIGVAPYFLSVQGIVEMARERDILCQGRGSAANSAVCFCLGITAVDPERSNLLFERFLSAERREPPDIDVDFEHERREEVIQEIYARYGRDRAAMVCEIISYRGRSALRDVGKVFGLSLEQVERLSSLVSWWDRLDGLPDDRVRATGFDPADGRVRQVLALARAIQGFPRHLSIHVGGFVLSAEELVNVAPVEPATMPNRTIIPWDKDDLDTLGFFKVDVLGLGMLTAIRRALVMVADAHARLHPPTGGGLGRVMSSLLAAIPAEDPHVYDALCAADTVGVFQIESRAQMAMLPRLRPQCFYDLVVEVAIVRPGPIQGGMVHPYLRRRTGEEPVEMPHPSLAPILARTLGVPLFQEQVMQIAIAGAGYSGGDADQLRRDMAAWRKTGRLERHKARLLEGFATTGISAEMGERLYRSIEGFGEYGFPESHAASFALLVYASAWIKVHHPVAFAAALVNSQPMGFYSPGSIVKDAERHGVEVLPARVDASDWDCTIEGPDRALRLGLRVVKGLGEETGKRVEAARRQRAFASVEDLVARARLDAGDLDALARSGALVGFGLERREAMWRVKAPRETGLLAGVELGDPTPRLPTLSRAEQLVLDYETTGVAVGDHAMRVVRPRLPARFKSSRDLASTPHGAHVSTAGMVICRQRPGTASGVVFVTLEDEWGFVNLVLWARTFEKWRHVATTSSMLVAHGKVERHERPRTEGLESPEARALGAPGHGDVVYVIPSRLEPLTLAGVPSMSRDFR